MDRDFRKGYLEIDSPTQPFASPLPLLGDSIHVFLADLPFLAAAALVYLRGYNLRRLRRCTCIWERLRNGSQS